MSDPCWTSGDFPMEDAGHGDTESGHARCSMWGEWSVRMKGGEKSMVFGERLAVCGVEP